ncbi:hypothetical protein NC796_09820 [Aliifodinibius sp. S!AR15-10]|uniref:hypothetical protein n=1 Tax=Aliifodinibius sp. S!AR15-10 TaxID=2950437 RepID=UPI0028671E00|nr:hypothetical protein [Aliifodinibius sp. S!AR15-10]MDR8391436.1 hypothetical protein [Aliifodinibius sp. S!AR15-10]
MNQNTTLHIVFWAFILHTVWEFTQCLFLYSMWDWPFWEATIWMWAAIFGDILIVLGIWKMTTLLMPSQHIQPSNLKEYALLIGISFPLSIFLEWVAKVLDLWEYSSNMAVIELLNYQVGLSPILQITFLPALSLYLAEKSTKKFNHRTK